MAVRAAAVTRALLSTLGYQQVHRTNHSPGLPRRIAAPGSTLFNSRHLTSSQNVDKDGHHTPPSSLCNGHRSSGFNIEEEKISRRINGYVFLACLCTTLMRIDRAFAARLLSKVKQRYCMFESAEKTSMYRSCCVAKC